MSKLAILCVDDEDIILNSLVRQLQDEFENKYMYETAENGQEALELEEENINVIVIVSDWLMPGMKGDELLVEIHKKFPRVIKILLTGQADEIAIERAKTQAHLDQYISKPWKKEELIAAIKSGLAKL
jgi:CheY-like chemotaxis protein